MSRIGVVTDSSCDLPRSVVDDLGIDVVPLTVRFRDEALEDGVDLGPAEFWRRLEGTDRLPETAAPSPGRFLDVFNAAVDAGGIDGLVCICLSSELSGTYQAAVLAAEQASIPVRVVDSRCVSMALGLAVMAAAEVAGDGAALEEVASASARAAARCNVFAAVDTLTYLERGGRIGQVSALVGGLLDIKPLITLEDGAVAAGGRVRTRSKAIAAIVRHASSLRLERVSVLHAGAGSAVTDLMEALSQIAPDPIVAELGPVVGTHTGPGVLGVAYMEA